MKNRNTYQFLVGKRKLNFDSNTMGGAYDKAVHWAKKNTRFAGKPVFVKKLNVETVPVIG